MSACISTHGEYSEHEMDETGFACLHCGFDDVEAMCARIAELEASVEERAGWRRPAEVIETSEELEALPVLSIVVIPNGLAVQKWRGDGVTWWIGASDSLVRLTSHRLISIWREVILLHVPGRPALPWSAIPLPEGGQQ